MTIEMETRARRRGLAKTRGLGRRSSWSEHLGHGDPGRGKRGSEKTRKRPE